MIKMHQGYTENNLESNQGKNIIYNLKASLIDFANI